MCVEWKRQFCKDEKVMYENTQMTHITRELCSSFVSQSKYVVFRNMTKKEHLQGVCLKITRLKGEKWNFSFISGIMVDNQILFLNNVKSNIRPSTFI